MTDQWSDRLSEYLDGDLSPDESAALEAHLRECPECERTVRDLRAVVARANQVLDRPPAADLWPQIAARIAAPRPQRRLAFSVPQLAAASIALMLLSAGTMYVLVNRDAPVVASAAGGAQRADSPTITRDVKPANVKSVAAENYDVAISDLETALQNGRARLDTATVRVLEKNLRTIDAAIAEARQALGRDPANPYLNRYLDETLQRKVQLLRRAAGIVRAQT